MKYDDLDKLNELKSKGAITEAEYDKEKEKILDGDVNGSVKFWGMEENTYSMLLHISLLSGCIVPFAGLIFPIVMWSANKTRSDKINRHGRHAINWILSFIIYVIICVPLCLVIVGIPMLIALIVTNIIFCIMAGVKAGDGIVWKYPMAISFL